jgi:hypothetical protein
MKNKPYVYQREDNKVWPWGYHIPGFGDFITDSEKDAKKKISLKAITELNKQVAKRRT